MPLRGKPRIAVVYNRDFEGADLDPENKAREDIKQIADHIVSLLTAAGHPAKGLGVTDDVFEALGSIKTFDPAVVFNLCESIDGDNRFESLLPQLLDLAGIAYTGAGPLALCLALHKHKAKEVLRAQGIPTPAGFVLREPNAAGRDLRFPLIVKPTREDASVGISSGSVVHDRAALEERVRYVLAHYGQPALVEEYIEGREIYVSILERVGEKPQVFPFFEIDFSDLPDDRPRIVSFEGKWVEGSVEYNGTRPVRCEGLFPATEQRIVEVALAAFEAMELRDYGRLDVRLAKDGTPYIIDVNPNCDLSAVAGGFAKAAKAAGLTYEDVIMRLLELALARRRHASTIPLAKRSKGTGRAAGPRGGESVPAGGGVVRARAARRGAGSA